jgi:NAD(P)-dependent dehydrogenase (short-subunit alcohol dehydrogenase family)
VSTRGSQRCLVTGGGGGIGREIAIVLGRAGARVAVLDIDVDCAETVASEVRQAGGEPMALRASVTDPAELGEAFTAVDAAWGGLDLLVNNAGVSANRPTLALPHDEWRRAIDINLNGVFYAAQEAGRRMVAQGGGSIVNIASIYGEVAAPQRAAYCASKAAVAMLTKVLAIEWAAHGVRVNAVAPGYVETALTTELVRDGRLDLAAMERRTPMGRLGQPADIANAVQFLASEQAAYVTGQVLGVDGGWTAYGYI